MKLQALILSGLSVSLLSYLTLGEQTFAQPAAPARPAPQVATQASSTPPTVTRALIRLDLSRTDYILHSDTTYDLIQTQDITILSPLAIPSFLTMTSPTYFPPHESVQLVEAYTIDRHGKKYTVQPDAVSTMSSPSQNNIYILSTQKIVSLPKLQVGSKIHVVWRYQQLTKSSLTNSFSVIAQPMFQVAATRTLITIDAPASMYLQWTQTGGFTVSEVTQNQHRRITASLGPQPAYIPESFMTSPHDALPRFEATTFRSWSEVGTALWNSAHGSSQVTPEIKDMVHKIVGKNTGRAAVKALYDWVATHISYLAVFIDARQGYVPTPAAQVLRDRYGDCKAHSNLLLTFLKVLHIDSYLVEVDWNNQMTAPRLPTASPFDHVMLYIPKYHVFANPTDQYNPFGSPLEQTNYVPNGLQVLANKYVLIVKPTGSTLTYTPAAVPAQNQYQITTQSILNNHGDFTATGTMMATGSPGIFLRAKLLDAYAPYLALNNIFRMNGQNGDAGV